MFEPFVKTQWGMAVPKADAGTVHLEGSLFIHFKEICIYLYIYTYVSKHHVDLLSIGKMIGVPSLASIFLIGLPFYGLHA